MAKLKKKLTNAQKRAKKAAKAERQKKYQWVFMNGKQVRIKRPPTIDGMSVDEFIEQNADPIWLHQNEMWEFIKVEEVDEMEYLESTGENVSHCPVLDSEKRNSRAKPVLTKKGDLGVQFPICQDQHE